MSRNNGNSKCGEYKALQEANGEGRDKEGVGGA
jgi:hypothetical protein